MMQAKRSSYAPFLPTTIYDEQLSIRTITRRNYRPPSAPEQCSTSPRSRLAHPSPRSLPSHRLYRTRGRLLYEPTCLVVRWRNAPARPARGRKRDLEQGACNCAFGVSLQLIRHFLTPHPSPPTLFLLSMDGICFSMIARMAILTLHGLCAWSMATT